MQSFRSTTYQVNFAREGIHLGIKNVQFVQTSINGFDTAVTVLKQIQTNPEIRAKLKRELIWDELKLLFTRTLAYATTVRNLCGYAEDLRKKCESIKNTNSIIKLLQRFGWIKNRNKEILRQFLSILKRSYDEVCKRKAEWQSKLDCFNQEIQSSREICNQEIEKAKRKKKQQKLLVEQ